MKRFLTTACIGALSCVAFALLALGDSPEADALDTGVIFGAYSQPVGTQTNEIAIDILERELGATLPMVRTFSDWDDGLGADKPLHTWVESGDRDIMVSIKPRRRSGAIIPWTAIATAQPGSDLYHDMQALADGAKRFERPMIVSFHHEPEQGFNTPYGSNADFKAAFRTFRAVFDAEGVTNVHFAWVMTEWAFAVGDIDPTDRRRADAWYPGDDVVDMIASDTYNWDNCRGGNDDPWTSLEDDLAPLMRFSAKHPDKPLILAELGSDEAATGRKAAWLEEARQLFKTEPYREAFAAVLYFHDDGRAEGWPQCDWWLDSTQSSLEAAQAWATDPFYRAGLNAPAARPVEPPPPTVPTTKAPRPPLVVTETCDGRAATIVGTSGDDQLRGTASNDVIVGRSGNDTINGLGGDDIICGGAGDDELTGDGGADRLYGGPGRDVLRGGLGPDVIYGGTGPDRLNGQHGNDTLYGNEGKDVIRGGPHQDTLRGGAHADRLLGQGGSDMLAGGSGNDRIEGGVGMDTILGGAGVDTCLGGPGVDTQRCEAGRS